MRMSLDWRMHWNFAAALQTSLSFDGMVSCYPGLEGGGSIDLNMSTTLDSMSAHESNQELMEAVLVSS